MTEGQKQFSDSLGGDYVHKYELSNHIDKFFQCLFSCSHFLRADFFTPSGFLKKLLGKRNKRAFSKRIGCERGRKDKPYFFYTTNQVCELYEAIFF